MGTGGGILDFLFAGKGLCCSLLECIDSDGFGGVCWLTSIGRHDGIRVGQNFCWMGGLLFVVVPVGDLVTCKNVKNKL